MKFIVEIKDVDGCVKAKTYDMDQIAAAIERYEEMEDYSRMEVVSIKFGMLFGESSNPS